MQILPASIKQYKSALIKYHSRQSIEELEHKVGSPDLNVFLNAYLRRAHSPQRLPNYKTPIQIYVIFNEGIEFGMPHTLDNIIIISPKLLNRNVLMHEFMHIYFRYVDSPSLAQYMKKKNIVVIRRQRLPNEITNPDTHYYTGLLYAGKIIFIALIYVNDKYFIKSYNVFKSGYIRPATDEERIAYDAILPFNQNYHPEEILATLMSV